MWQSCIDKLLSRAMKVYTYNTTCRIKELPFIALKCNTPYSYVVTQSGGLIPFLKEHKQMIHFSGLYQKHFKSGVPFFFIPFIFKQGNFYTTCTTSATPTQPSAYFEICHHLTAICYEIILFFIRTATMHNPFFPLTQ